MVTNGYHDTPAHESANLGLCPSAPRGAFGYPYPFDPCPRSPIRHDGRDITTMTTYKIVGINGIYTIEADRYRIAHPMEESTQGELYLYEQNNDEAIAMFPAGTWHSIAEADAVDFMPEQ